MAGDEERSDIVEYTSISVFERFKKEYIESKFKKSMTKPPNNGRVLMLLENCCFLQDRRVRQEAKSLEAVGYQVTVISPRKEGQAWREEIDNIAVYCFPSPPEGDTFLAYLWEYAYATLAIFILSWVVLFREGFDVIHTHNPPDTLVLIAAFYKLFGKRFIFDHHDLAPELYFYARFSEAGNQFVYKILIWLEQLNLGLADHIITTNESYRILEMDRGNIPEEKITVVRNGPDLERVRLLDPDPKLQCKAKFLIGFVGDIGFQDGVDCLLRALWFLINDLGREDFYCVVMGDGNALPSVKRMAKELDLKEHVEFTGWLTGDDPIRALSTIDLGVAADPSNPYNDYSTMIKLSEYMALGKPIVAFDLPENKFTAQQAALYAKPNDELDFARQIACLMDDPSKRIEMGQIGMKRVASELSWSRQEEHLISVYDSLGLVDSPSIAHEKST